MQNRLFEILENPKMGFDLTNTTTKTSIANVFAERSNSNINEFMLFIAHFNAIPNFTHEINIDCKRAHEWFATTYYSEIKDSYYFKRYLNRSTSAEIDDVFYFLFEDLLINFDTNMSNVRFLFRKTAYSNVKKLIEEIRGFKKRRSKDKPELNILIQSISGIDSKPFTINKPKLQLQDNYNNDFLAIHKTILNRLSKKHDKGLVLLHGKPGTGKTSYIRYLIASLKKEVFFLPPDMAAMITNPKLIGVFIDNPNSVFVIEDAEKIIVDRERDGFSPVSALLNISDGLLSDCLNVQIICSFNTDISKIDRALMRKGRLIAKYEFNELAIDKAQRLSDKLGFTTTIQQPMTLAAIYNQEEKDFQEIKRNSIGFNYVKENYEN